MTVLVFGKTGQVARALQRLGPVEALGRDEADLCDPSVCSAKIRQHAPSAVINAAAYTQVDKAEDEEELAQVINGDAPAAMARACAEVGIPFVHISTDYVFDGNGNLPFKEGSPTGPISAYGRTKLAGEECVIAAGGVYAILRTSWVFSADGNNFVKTMLRLGASRDQLSIVSDQIGGPTSATAIAQACLTLARQLQADPSKAGIYHFAGSPDASWADFAKEIFAQANLTCDVVAIPTSSYPTPAKRPLNSRLDCDSILANFGITRPQWAVDLKTVLEEISDKEE